VISPIKLKINYLTNFYHIWPTTPLIRSSELVFCIRRVLTGKKNDARKTAAEQPRCQSLEPSRWSISRPPETTMGCCAECGCSVSHGISVGLRRGQNVPRAFPCTGDSENLLDLSFVQDRANMNIWSKYIHTL